MGDDLGGEYFHPAIPPQGVIPSPLTTPQPFHTLPLFRIIH